MFKQRGRGPELLAAVVSGLIPIFMQLVCIILLAGVTWGLLFSTSQDPWYQNGYHIACKCGDYSVALYHPVLFARSVLEYLGIVAGSVLLYASISSLGRSLSSLVWLLRAELFGLSHLIESGVGRRIHEDQCGVLYAVRIRGFEPRRAVVVRNATPDATGSLEEFVLQVPPNMKTAREAVAWTFGLAESEYGPAEQS